MMIHTPLPQALTRNNLLRGAAAGVPFRQLGLPLPPSTCTRPSSAWNKAQQAGFGLVDALFSRNAGLGSLRTRLEDCFRDLPRARQMDYVGAMPWHHTARSTEYFSCWVELTS
jgi:hypothetical protein